MDIRNKLDHVFSSHCVSDKECAEISSVKYVRLAESYAETEMVVAVLSDLKHHSSHVFYGRFADMLALEREGG